MGVQTFEFGIMSTSLQLALLTNIDLSSEWLSWKNKFEKIYANQSEEHLRFGHFQRNVDFVRNHNKKYVEGKESYYVGLNKLADLTREEINSRYLEPIDTSAPGSSGGSCSYLYKPDSSWSGQTNCPGCYSPKLKFYFEGRTS